MPSRGQDAKWKRSELAITPRTAQMLLWMGAPLLMYLVEIPSIQDTQKMATIAKDWGCWGLFFVDVLGLTHQDLNVA